MKDYKKRITNLRQRRQDDLLREAVISKSFTERNYGDSTKYVLESMQEIDQKYTNNTYEASKKVQGYLKPGLSQYGINVEFRHQGSVETRTHIKLHSDIDLLVITHQFETLEHPQVPPIPYQGNPLQDLKNLRDISFRILDTVYASVDNSNSKAIAVAITDPKRKIDVIPSNWYNTNDYARLNQEIYRGIQIYDRDKNLRLKDLPFLHIFRINYKDTQVDGGLKKIIRLLKTLKIDADISIDLSSYDITAIAYNIDEIALKKPKYETLKLLLVTSKHLEQIINNQTFRENLYTPNNMEKIFGIDTSKLNEVKKLKIELDEVIVDIGQELRTIQKNIESNVDY